MCESTKHNTLADIRNVRIDGCLPQDEKLTEFVTRIKDPYHYRCGTIAITAKFDNSGPKLTECISKVPTF